MASTAVAHRPPAPVRTGIQPVAPAVTRDSNFPLYFLIVGMLFTATFTNQYYGWRVINVGVNVRVMDFIILANLGVGMFLRFSRRTRRVAVVGEQIVVFMITAFLLVGLLETARGIPRFGSFAIGVARYTLLDLLWVPVMILLVDSEKKLSTVLYVLVSALPVCWLIRLALFYSGALEVPVDQGTMEQNDSERFIDAYAAISLATLGAMTFPFAAVRWKGKKLSYFPATLISILTLGFVGLAQSRSVWLGTVAGVSYLFCKLVVRTSGKQRKYVIRAFALSILLVSLALMMLAVLAPSLSERRLAFLTGLEKDSTGYWRIQGWIWVMRRVIVKNPIFGMGFGDIGFPDPSFPENFLDVPDHNQYVTVLRSMGFLGLMLYGALLVLAFRLGKRVFRIAADSFSRLRILGITTGLMMSIVYAFFYNHPPQLGIGIGLLFVCGRIAASTKVQHR